MEEYTVQEHLQDELSRIRALVNDYVEFVRFRQSSVSQNDHIGLYISDEDIDNILTDNEDVQFSHEKAENIGKEIHTKISKDINQGLNLPLIKLKKLFQLSDIEYTLLLLVLLPEVDIQYGKVYGYLQDNMNQALPTSGLMIALLEKVCNIKNSEEIYQVFFSKTLLWKYSLLEYVRGSEGASHAKLSMRINERILKYIYGFNSIDSDVDGDFSIFQYSVEKEKFVIPECSPSNMEKVIEELLEKSFKDKRPIFHLIGPESSGKCSTINMYCSKWNIPLGYVDIKRLLGSGDEINDKIALIFRESILQPCAIYIDNFQALDINNSAHIKVKDEIYNWIQNYNFLVFIASIDEGSKLYKPPFSVYECRFKPANYEIRKKLWKANFPDSLVKISDDEFSYLAENFIFSGWQILKIAQQLDGRLIFSDKSLFFSDVLKVTNNVTVSNLNEYATLLKTDIYLENMALTDEQGKQAQEIIDYINTYHVFSKEWGFEKGLVKKTGVSILLCGASGTGKSTLASVIANEVGLKVYRIDLASLVSKYIGETEKNLSKIFDDADKSRAVLFFDEADALFSKRTGVKDAHDKYANLEVSYLLQKIEEYKGVSILASNYRSNIDEAFSRRIQFVIEFSMPGERQRLNIWNKVFPNAAPVDENIDYEFLAKRLIVSGGNIRNIALMAAFYAARSKDSINMQHIMLAAKHEFKKIGKPFIQAEFFPYVELAA